MIASKSDFKLLPAIFVLLWPLRVIFPVVLFSPRVRNKVGSDLSSTSAYLIISLALIMRLISSTMAELTHTDVLSESFRMYSGMHIAKC